MHLLYYYFVMQNIMRGRTKMVEDGILDKRWRYSTETEQTRKRLPLDNKDIRWCGYLRLCWCSQ